MHLTKVYTTYCGLRKLPSAWNILSRYDDATSIEAPQADQCPNGYSQCAAEG